MGSVVKELSVQRTPQDKGTTLKIEVTCYDNGLWAVNGQPVYSYEHGKMGPCGQYGAKHLVNEMIDTFAEQVDRERR